MKARIHLPTFLGLTLLAGVAQPAALPPRAELGRSVKLRILVDKVMQPQAKWVTKEWMVAEAAKAGFNVFSPRAGYDRLDEVKQVATWCAKYGMYHLPWMRGSLGAPKGPAAAGKRLVWANGGEQPLWSPNSDEFWKWTTKYITAYARMSVDLPALLGVFLDYENYASGPRQGNCYSLSYDQDILTRFADAKGLDLPRLAPAQRKPWLEEHGLHDDFAAFQIDHWRRRCRALREAVDRYNPKFQFCVYPAPGTLFIVKACYPEWATPAAPLVLADASTYGRSSRFQAQAAALKRNQEVLKKNRAIPQKAGIPFIYTGGIDPVVSGADAEFCGKNAVLISQSTGGYWVFYEGPSYTVDHADYFQWFTWANQHIAAGALTAWQEPRRTPEGFSLTPTTDNAVRARLKAPPVTGKQVTYPLVKLRGDNLLLLACKANQPVEVTLRNHQVGRYHSQLVWELRTPGMNQLKKGVVPDQGEGTVSFTPATDGIYVLGASAGSCAYSVRSANVPVGLFTGQRLRLIQGAERLYFKVPKGVSAFTLHLRGSGGETVRANVFDPAGNQVATGQTTLANMATQLDVPVEDHAGQVWSVELTKADEGTLEDNSLQLDPHLPPVVSLSPGQVFDLEPRKPK